MRFASVNPIRNLNVDALNHEIGYVAAHARLVRYLGEPSSHLCAFHETHTAQEFALIEGGFHCRTEVNNPVHLGKPYSTNPLDYVPMCISAHRKMDKAKLRLRRAVERLAEANGNQFAAQAAVEKAIKDYNALAVAL